MVLLSQIGILLRQLLVFIAIRPHLIKVSQVLLSLHLERFTLSAQHHQCQVLLIQLLVQALDLVLQVLNAPLEDFGGVQILRGSRPEILSNHAVFIDKVLVALLNGVELLFKLLDVFFLRHFHLLEDLFLRVQLTIQGLSSCDSVVDLMLELEVLLLQDLDLTIG